jgi:magnesium transporter
MDRAQDHPAGAPAAGEDLLEAAIEHATTSVPTATPGQTAGQVRAALARGRFDYAGAVAVVDAGRLVGLLAIEPLLAAGDDELVSRLMDAAPPTVAPGVDQERVAWEMVRRGESSVGVVNSDGRFIGLVSPYRMLQVLLHEHDEDLARLGGYLRSSRGARLAAEEPVSRRLWHRLPWLLIGLGGAMLSAVLVAAYESELQDVLLLAFFLPGIVYMADAVGTQTEAVLIRGLAVGIETRRVVRRELATGVGLGVALGGAFILFALIGWGDEKVAAAVGLALFAACSIATLVAMALPLLFRRLGLDPAFGSGPLATVIQDLLSIVVYLAISAAIVT